MIAMRSPMRKASSRSCDTKTMVRRCSRCSSSSRPCISVRLSGSSAEKASSISISVGSTASARARPTRCCMPPDNSDGSLWAKARRPTCSSTSIARRSRAARATPATSRPKAVLRSTVRCGNSAKDWNTIAMSLRRSATSSRAGMVVMSRPPSRMLPAVGSMRRLMSRISVDLPEPERPMSTKISPSRTEKLASRTPTTLPVCWKICSLSLPARSSSRACSGRLPKTLKRLLTVILSAVSGTWTPAPGRRPFPQAARTGALFFMSTGAACPA